MLQREGENFIAPSDIGSSSHPLIHNPFRVTLDLQSRVNGKHIDLHKLWNVVTARGGYDSVSQEKLAWRRVGQEFNLGATNAAAYAFALKTVYYKNLASVPWRIVILDNSL